ncbi:MAG: VanZ family protein [Clostridiales bacterium]|jgi:VanZ family protein|nr:VanZ family protein [Clostridiales bacterium]MCI2161641.1 VanZ family protein [Oscillospiraceae bacterium]MCI1962412.1 VanZ family protein [Clostridiales bacterium]MCI2022680.1 VanZ family protein [Clostridiales bacterium]MCI2027005.1 VanZ family protein [Clostridiales bacterium]
MAFFRSHRVMIILLIFTLCFIWGNSLLPASVSEAFSERVSDLVNMIWHTLDHKMVFSGDGVLRKIAHATEFAALGMETLVLFQYDFKKNWTSIFLFGVSTALIDETIQLFIAGRSGEVRDIWIDFAGFLLGVLLIHITLGRRERKKTDLSLKR